jgi:hypothetical protein
MSTIPPILSGIPTLPPGVATGALALVTSAALSAAGGLQAFLWQSAQTPPAWGVFDANGNQVLFPDSVLDFTQRQEYDIANFPIQEGAFASYNKVIRPFEISVRFRKTANVLERQSFLQDIAGLSASLNLYTVRTPEAQYGNVNLERYEVIRHGARHAYALEVDCYFVQILQVTPQYTNTAVTLPNATPASAQPTDSVGNLYLVPPTTQQAQLGTGALESQWPGGY